MRALFSLSPQPWIHSKGVDSVFILAPAFIAVLVVFVFRAHFDETTGLPLWVWVSLILCVDVAHVYSTLFRTYFNKKEFLKNKTLFTIIPLLIWVVGVLLYKIDALLFWRVLAYIAVFHFIRQQYGFMMLYSRRETDTQRKFKWIDKTIIYLSTLYPLIYWHTHLPRNFHWFIDGDFVMSIPKFTDDLTLAMYLLAIVFYLYKEFQLYKKEKYLNIPKNLIILGTALSWYLGIVLLNGDIAFTVTNVIAHGIPYMALIWMYGNKQARTHPNQPLILNLTFTSIFTKRMVVPLFLSVLLLFAFIEEGLWAGFIWREHLDFFTVFATLPKIEDKATLSWLVPLLVLPQSTHYILDGFIWRLHGKNSTWKNKS